MTNIVFFLRHTLNAVFITGLLNLLWIFFIDTPKVIYFCPLDRFGLMHHWIDHNCYWSSSYSEAREKFVSIGNRMREQIQQLQQSSPDLVLYVTNITSISYDVSDKITTAKYGDYPSYIRTLKPFNASTFEVISPGEDTMNAMLLELIIPTHDNSKEHLDIIHTSGVHGVEGYAGSAVQLRFLHELFLQNEKYLQNSKKISQNDKYKIRRLLLVHAVNPFGMRHHRRTNENNVDLNRNALTKDMWNHVQSRDPNFASYVEFDSILNPFMSVNNDFSDEELFTWVDSARKRGFHGAMNKLKERDDQVKHAIYRNGELPKQYDLGNMTLHSILFENKLDWIEEKFGIVKIIGYALSALLRVGFINLKRAIVSSQYLKPSGIQYGGGAHKYHESIWENSIFALEHAVNDFFGFRSVDNQRVIQSSSPYQRGRILWIDVHTGLGVYGNHRFLGPLRVTDLNNSSLETNWIGKLLSILGESFLSMGASSDDGVSEGYDLTMGFVNSDILCRQPHCFSVTQEFGTQPSVLVGICLILENKGYQTGKNNYGYAASWAFNPNRQSWRRKVLKGGIDLLRIALDL